MSPARSQSRDAQEHTGIAGAKTGNAENGKPGSKTKGTMGSKVTMSEMKRRVSAMFDYISKTQLELAGEAPPPPSHESRRSSRENEVSSSTLPLIKVNGSGSPKKPPEAKHDASTPESGDRAVEAAKEFKELSCVEMMDFLTRDLVHWQSQFAA